MIAAIVLIGVYSPKAYAASKVVVHAKDGASWGTVNIFNWGDAGEILGAWPGTEMKAESDGWYTYTVDTDHDLNLVFSAKGGSPQTNDLDVISKDAGEVWVVIGGNAGENAKGISSTKVELFTKPEAGWPTVVATKETVTKDDETKNTVTEKSTTNNTQDKTTVEATATYTDTEPNTGENVGPIVISIIGLAVSASLLVVFKKNKQISKN